jgi:hypothetical protein
MDEALVEKTKIYQESVNRIAATLFHTFYYAPDDEVDFLPNGPEFEQDLEFSLLDKADKIYHFFQSADEAIKMIRFLVVVNPAKAKEIVDGL